MKDTNLIAKTSLMLGLIALTFLSGCVFPARDGYREGYWDREHARYYHNHAWVACGHEDEHCR
jgi:hypothetical protein